MPWAADKPRGEKRKLYRKIFEECDADGNSLICLDELDNFLRSSGRGLPRDVVRYVHDLADKGGNRTLDFDEFVDLLEHPDWQHVFERWVNSYVHFLVPCPKGAAALVPAAPTTDYARGNYLAACRKLLKRLLRRCARIRVTKPIQLFNKNH